MSDIKVRSVSPELAKKASEELGEDPKRTPSDIAHIRQWFSKQPHLAHIQLSDQWILSFLRGSKFSLEKCKQKLDMYYTMKTLVPEIFQNRDPLNPIIQEILKIGSTLVVKEVEGPAEGKLFITRPGIADFSKYSMMDMLKTSFMITDILLQEDDNYVIGGQILLVDLKHVSFSAVSQFTPTLGKKVTTASEKSYPIRQKVNHMLNPPQIVETAIGLFRSLLSDKLKKRLFVHNANMESFFKVVPKKMIPKDLGGEGESYEELAVYWKAKVESYRDWFLEQENYKSDESKRPGKPQTTESMFGVEGSFRKLDVD